MNDEKSLSQSDNPASDTERLDFLIAHSAWLSFSGDHEVCNVWHETLAGQRAPMEGWPQKNYHTPREAIDAAQRAWERRVRGIVDGAITSSREIASAMNPRGRVRHAADCRCADCIARENAP